jgi:hypothetical protein
MTLVISKGLTLDNGTRAAAIAGVSPTLDYRFAREKREIETVSLTDKLTYTGGNGTFVGSDGFIQPATTNVPRFDHDPLSRQSFGLLVEEQRTNSIRNNTMVGAVAGTPGTLPTNWAISGQGLGTLTQQVVGTGAIGGITYIDVKFSGTTSTSDFSITQETATQIIAANGQFWTGSVWLSVVGGSKSNISSVALNAVERTSAGGFVAQQSGSNLTSSLSSALTRYTASYTLAGGATVARIQPRLVNLGFFFGVAIDITLRIGLPQLEQGATASTPIPTTTTAVTRTADNAVIDGTGVLTGTYTMVEKPAGCAVVSGSNINLEPGFTAERVMVFPAALDAGQITAIRGAM